MILGMLKLFYGAYNNDIISGKTETEFDPNSDITREQMVAVYIAMQKHKGYNS